MSQTLRIVAAPLIGMVLACGDPCHHRKISEVPSPDDRYVAVTYHDACGATVTPGTTVALIGRKGGWSENVFGGNTTNKQQLYDTAGGPRVTARWRARDILELTYDREMAAGFRPAEVRGVRVTYVAR